MHGIQLYRTFIDTPEWQDDMQVRVGGVMNTCECCKQKQIAEKRIMFDKLCDAIQIHVNPFVDYIQLI